MADFVKAYYNTMKIEGGYSNRPNDRGGETWKGIARNANPTWEGWKIIDEMKLQNDFPNSLNGRASIQPLVLSFYKMNYWDVNRLDRFTNDTIAEEVWDTGVNMGVETAAEFLQRALNLLNNQQKSYPDIPVDRKIGPQTIELVNNHKYPATLVKILNVLQGARYIAIGEKDKTQEENIRGWFDQRVKI